MVEDERRIAGWQSWTSVRALAANRSGWKENVKALCALLHEEIYIYRERETSKTFVAG